VLAAADRSDRISHARLVASHATETPTTSGLIFPSEGGVALESHLHEALPPSNGLRPKRAAAPTPNRPFTGKMRGAASWGLKTLATTTTFIARPRRLHPMTEGKIVAECCKEVRTDPDCNEYESVAWWSNRTMQTWRLWESLPEGVTMRACVDASKRMNPAPRGATIGRMKFAETEAEIAGQTGQRSSSSALPCGTLHSPPASGTARVKQALNTSVQAAIPAFRAPVAGVHATPVRWR